MNASSAAKPVLAFDIYGTVIDTAGVVSELTEQLGDAAKARAISDLWRAKQLEYAFRRGLMRNFVSFVESTRQALDYAAAFNGAELSDGQKQTLMGVYKKLPPFPDARDGLAALRGMNVRSFAFSMGGVEAVRELLSNVDLLDAFEDVISIDAVRSFKPDPAVYASFLREAGATGEQAWLISGNPFDVIGGISAGWRGIWVQRNPATLFDPWEIKPTKTVKALTELPALFGAD